MIYQYECKARSFIPDSIKINYLMNLESVGSQAKPFWSGQESSPPHTNLGNGDEPDRVTRPFNTKSFLSQLVLSFIKPPKKQCFLPVLSTISNQYFPRAPVSIWSITSFDFWCYNAFLEGLIFLFKIYFGKWYDHSWYRWFLLAGRDLPPKTK